MKATSVALVCIILCAQILTSFAVEDLVTIRPEANGVDRTISLQEGNGRENEVKRHDILYTAKARRGRGSGGGSDVVHQRPNTRSLASLPNSSSFFISAIVGCLSFGLPLVTPS